MQVQEVLLGVPGQRFVFDPPDGRPDAEPVPAVMVRDGDRAVRVTTGACIVDPVDTRLHGDAMAGFRSLRVASSDGMVPGGRYLMTRPDRSREWIDVVAIHGDRLVLARPLLHRYAGNATIVGCRVSIAVDPLWSSRRENLSDHPAAPTGLARYVLRWRYHADGVALTGLTYADLVASRSAQIVTRADVVSRQPGSQGGDFIDEAFRVVRLEANGDAAAQRRLHDNAVLRELVAMRANLIAIEHAVMHGAPRADELAVAEERYRRCYERLVGRTGTRSPAPRRIPKLTR
jgi:hypothetical protein